LSPYFSKGSVATGLGEGGSFNFIFLCILSEFNSEKYENWSN